MAFTPKDFFSSDEQASLTAGLPVAQGGADPLQSLVDEADQKVTDYTTKYAVDLTRRRRLVRGLVFFSAYAAVGPVPEQHVKNFDTAMAELKDIRDGKFPDLLIQSPTAPVLATPQGAWGSRKKI